MRDHAPVVIEEFNGWWKRGDKDSVPLDHFADCENVQFIQGGFRTRDGLDTYRGVPNVLRLYTFVTQESETILILTVGGDIYHSVDDSTLYGPILSIPEMTDFSFAQVAGRAYITPFTTEQNSLGINFERGLQNEFVYVYKGDGTPARKAAGFPPSAPEDTPLVAYNNLTIGKIDQGLHLIGVSFSNGSDDSTAIGTTILPIIYAPGGYQAVVANIPIGTAGITERKIWATRALDPATFDPNTSWLDYTFYHVATIPDNTSLSWTIDFADSELLTAFVAGTLPNPTSGGMVIENTNVEGYCDIGLHIIGVVYETDTGYLTAPGPETLAIQTFTNEKRKIRVSNIPVSPDSFVTKRHLVASKAISSYNGDDLGFQLFFIPTGTIENNIDTELELSFYDADLLDDASHLLDNYSEIPAGAGINTFNSRLVVNTTYNDISLALVSFPGEPEAISQIDGLLIFPLDGNPMTCTQEFRGVLYGFKKTKTGAWNDNGDAPSSWPFTMMDQGIGAPVHGIGTVLDSGGVNIDFLLIADMSGLMQFNGAYFRPELTWKIQDYWLSLDRNFFQDIQVMNDSLNQLIYITLPNKRILMGNYANGLNAKDIRWAPWKFDIETTTIALIETDILIIGAKQLR